MTELGDALARMTACVTTWRTDDGRTYRQVVDRRGPVHELDAGLYQAVIRDGVPMIERDNTASAVLAVFVPVSPPLLSEIRSDWSRPLQFMVDERGLFVFREVDTSPTKSVPVRAADPTPTERAEQSQHA